MKIKNSNPMFGNTTEIYETTSMEDFIKNCDNFLEPFSKDLANRLQVSFDFAYESTVFELIKGLEIIEE